MAPDPNPGTGSEPAEQSRTQAPGRRFRRSGRGRRGRGRRPSQSAGQSKAPAESEALAEQAPPTEFQEGAEQEAALPEDVVPPETESTAETAPAASEAYETGPAEVAEVPADSDREPTPPPPIERVALPEEVKQEFEDTSPKTAPAGKAASLDSIQKAIEAVNRVIESLRESLDDMEEVLETLELAERQKFADEQEIDQLRRALRHLHRGRDSGQGQRQPSHGSHGR